jgi:hypothetical protein
VARHEPSTRASRSKHRHAIRVLRPPSNDPLDSRAETMNAICKIRAQRIWGLARLFIDLFS